MPFDGFISYSHAADGRLAPAVQRGLHRLAKPWHRRRALWIFRDQTGLAVTPALWSSIQEALDGSRHFVLLASPEAARSKWVNREIEHWVATKSPDSILPVVTDGEWRWDPAVGDFTADSTAVPAALRGVFSEEPLFLDLRWARDDLHLSLQHVRFRDAIAQLAAPMHGVSKDELEGEDVRQHRRARRLSLAASTMLVMLTLIASLTGVVAVRNADRANAAAADARRQQQVASEQRSSAERATGESLRQQQKAQVQEKRAQTAAAEAERQERRAGEQQALARQASAEAGRQQENAGRQQDSARRHEGNARRQQENARLQKDIARRHEGDARRQQELADQAAARARQQEELAQQHRELARQAGEERRRQEQLAKKAAEEARLQREKAELQQRIAINRRLMQRARAMIDDDPKKALRLGVAAHRLHSDARTREQLSRLAMSTHHAGTLSGVVDVAPLSGQAVAAAGAGGTVRLWNVAKPATPVQLADLPIDGPRPKMLASSPDARTLAVFDGHSGAVLWDVTNPARPAPIAEVPSAAGIATVTFSHDGLTAATSDRDKNTTLWDMTRRGTPTVLATLPGAYPLKFSPDGRTGVTSGAKVIVWDLADRAHPVQLAALPPLLDVDLVDAAVEFHPKQPLVAVQEKGNYVCLWDLKDPANPRRGRTQTAVTSINTQFSRMAFSPDGRTLAYGDSDGTTALYALSDAWPWLSSRLAILNGRDGNVRSMTFSRDGRTLITSGERRTATLWSARGPFARDATAELTGTRRVNVAGLAFRPDGRSLIAADYDTGTAVPWDVADPAKPVRRDPLPLHIDKVERMAVSPDARTMAVIGSDKAVTLLDVTRPDRPTPLATIKQEEYAAALTFSPDGLTLAIGRFDGKATLWDLTNRKKPTVLAALTLQATLWSIAFSPDGHTMAVSEGPYVSLWDLTERATPVRVSVLPVQSGSSLSIAFSPDRRTLAVSRGHIPELWDVADPAQPHRLATLPGNTVSVEWLGFSPDGRSLLTAARDHIMMLWDVVEPTTPVRFATLQSPELQTAFVAFSPDGRTLAAGGVLIGRNKSITLWDYGVPNALRADATRYACATTGGGLTADEWARYIPELPHRRTC